MKRIWRGNYGCLKEYLLQMHYYIFKINAMPKGVIIDWVVWQSLEQCTAVSCRKFQWHQWQWFSWQKQFFINCPVMGIKQNLSNILSFMVEQNNNLAYPINLVHIWLGLFYFLNSILKIRFPALRDSRTDIIEAELESQVTPE